jgi:hypothetical protein
MNTYVVAGKEMWAGSYRSGNWGHRLRMDRTRQKLIDEANAADEEGLRLTAARPYTRDGKQLWAAIYRSGDWADKLFLDRSLGAFFKDTQKAFDDDGLRLTDVTTYMKDGKRVFAGISRAGD